MNCSMIIRLLWWMLIAIVAAPPGRADVLKDAPALRIPFPDTRLGVHGLGWFEETRPGIARLPARMKAKVPPKVWNLAQTPAGARIRFATDSDIVALVAEGATGNLAPHVTAMGQWGVDVYVDGVYRGSAAPDAKGSLRKEWFTGKTRARREIEIYLPYGRPITLKEVVLQPDAKVWPAKAYARAKPVVYYGSSITQGSAASNSGATYEAMLGRWLNVDFVNLGFSGNGFGEPALAEAVAELDASVFVVDYWANPTIEVYKATLAGFIDILRRKHPKTPILVTGPYYNPSEDVPGAAGVRQIEKRAYAKEFVAQRRAAGDPLIVHVDGLEMLSREQADGLADGRHANSMGFYFCARGLEPYLRTALGMPAREK
jgi:hypothetical protein